jgi:hypothetical protein
MLKWYFLVPGDLASRTLHRTRDIRPLCFSKLEKSIKYKIKHKPIRYICLYILRHQKSVRNILIQNLSTQATLNGFKAVILLAISVRPARWAIVCLLLSGPPLNAPTTECVTYYGQIAIYIWDVNKTYHMTSETNRSRVVLLDQSYRLTSCSKSHIQVQRFNMPLVSLYQSGHS